jgi:glutathione S-transferase
MRIAMYTFYYSPGACSLGPHIVLEEVGAPYERQVVKAGVATQTAEWKAVNPKGRIPALSPVRGSAGGAPDLLTEANAIMIYIARTYPEAGLIPSDPVGEARMVEWLNYLAAGVHSSIYGSIRRTGRFVEDEALFPPIQEKGRKSLREAFAYIEGLLADGRDWAVPGGYSLADIYLLVFYYFGRAPLFDMRTEFPAWAALVDKVAARPAVKRILAVEELQLP